ncbi:MAG: Fic family protein [Betaproteobacteria bacterium]
MEKAGYSALVDRYRLKTLPHYRTSEISGAARGHQLVETAAPPVHYRFETRYRPDPTLRGQLEFALKYEGVNLEILDALFEAAGPAEIEAWLKRAPSSAYARRIGFLYEWLRGEELHLEAPPNDRYIELLDPESYVVATNPDREPRFRVLNNLPGTRQFCPLVRRTKVIAEYEEKDIAEQVRSLIESKSTRVIERAVAYLYVKETRSSFGIEREKPSQDKAERFVDLLSRASSMKEITYDLLIDIQNLVMDKRWREGTYRNKQNWVGEVLGEYRRKVAYIPTAARDVEDLMEGVLKYISRSLRGTANIVASTAAASFGFVYVHPFMDSNGRIHRFLIHYMLENGGFTPRNTIIPVSAGMLEDLDGYNEALELFSNALMREVKYRWIDDEPEVTGNDARYYRFFDATGQTEYLYSAIERAVHGDLAQEIEYLIATDRARQEIGRFLDLPGRDLDRLIRLIAEQHGRLSQTKRDRHFPRLKAEEIEKAEAIVKESFQAYDELRGKSLA